MKRKFHRATFHILNYFIRFAIYYDARFYMKLFTCLLRKNGMVINGIPRFIANSAKFDDLKKVEIGDRLVISMNVRFLTHDYSYTTALISIGETPSTDVGILKKIIVGNNVFSGMNSILLPGTVVGNNVIIGAGAVLRGTIPDYSIVIGNPAKVVGDIREYAKKIKAKKNKEIRVDRK